MLAYCSSLERAMRESSAHFSDAPQVHRPVSSTVPEATGGFNGWRRFRVVKPGLVRRVEGDASTSYVR